MLPDCDHSMIIQTSFGDHPMNFAHGGSAAKKAVPALIARFTSLVKTTRLANEKEKLKCVERLLRARSNG